MRGPATIGELSGSRPRRRAARGTRGHRAAGRGRLRRDNYTASEHANHFSYDAMLRRTAVEDSSGVRYFTWDTNGMNLLAERDATGTVVASYTHGRAAVDGIGSCVGQELVQSGQTYYEFDICDHRGSVVRRVNDAGQVTGYFEYDAWGNYLRDEETGASSRFRYQSNWIVLKDSGGELYLSPTRVYHAGVGRFLGKDLWTARPGDYTYSQHNPNWLVDPDGKTDVTPTSSPGASPAPNPVPSPKPKPAGASQRSNWDAIDDINENVLRKYFNYFEAIKFWSGNTGANATKRIEREIGDALLAAKRIAQRALPIILADLQRIAKDVLTDSVRRFVAGELYIPCWCGWIDAAGTNISLTGAINAGIGGADVTGGVQVLVNCLVKEVCAFGYAGVGIAPGVPAASLQLGVGRVGVLGTGANLAKNYSGLFYELELAVGGGEGVVFGGYGSYSWTPGGKVKAFSIGGQAGVGFAALPITVSGHWQIQGFTPGLCIPLP